MAGILKIRNPDTGEFVEIPAIQGPQGIQGIQGKVGPRGPQGKTSFAEVPAKLKDQVRELLVDAGLPELVQE